MQKAYNISAFEIDTTAAAKNLLGCYLVHHTEEDGIIGGKIVETEAYLGKNDPACHSARGETARNKTMFKGAGYSYVYLIYGIHYCYNITTSSLDKPEAVLIRAVEPLWGIEKMKEKRKQEKLKNLCSGPGKLTKALGIDLNIDGQRVDNGAVRVYPGEDISEKGIVKTTRVGISSATSWNLRFYIENSKYISKK